MAAQIVDPSVLTRLVTAGDPEEAGRALLEGRIPASGPPGAAELVAALEAWAQAVRVRDQLRHRDPLSAAEVPVRQQALGVVVVLCSTLSVGVWGVAVGALLAGAGALVWLGMWRAYVRRWRAAGARAEEAALERQGAFRAAAEALVGAPWVTGPPGREVVNVPAHAALRALRRRLLDRAPRAVALDAELRAAVLELEAEAAAGRVGEAPVAALTAAVDAACAPPAG